jgi:hypothetical protein
MTQKEFEYIIFCHAFQHDLVHIAKKEVIEARFVQKFAKQAASYEKDDIY